MAKGDSHSISNIALIVGISLYIIGGVFGWQTITMSSTDGYTSQQQSFAPAGMWATFHSNYTNASVIFPFPSEYLSQNTTHNPIFTQARTSIFTVIWFMFLATLAIIFALGIVSALGSRKARTIITIVLIAIVVIEAGYFVSTYQTALNEDLENTGLSDMSMFGDEVVTTTYRLDSSLGMGFLFTILSIVAFVTGLLVDKAPSRREEPHTQKKKKETAAAAPAVVGAAHADTPREHIEKVTIECPQCGREFEVRVDVTKLPVKVQCPYCGTEGEIG